MSPTPQCTKCNHTPDGIDGHPGLEARPEQGRKGAGVSFLCTECRTRWLRRYVGGGVFQWTADGMEAAD